MAGQVGPVRVARLVEVHQLARALNVPDISMIISTSVELDRGGKFELRSSLIHYLNRARIRKPLKEPRNRFPVWRVGTTTLFDAPDRQAT